MRRPTLSSLPPFAELAQWGSAGLVIVAGWGAGRGLAAGMDTPHCAATGFALSGSIALAVALRRRLETLRSARG